MAKLYFRYGTVGSAKTLNLLAVAHNYAQQDKRALIIKPAIDDRFGRELVQSRAGVQKTADLIVEPDTVLSPDDFDGVDCIVVDEAQFLSTQLIDQLRQITMSLDIPVICYGLRTDFRTNLFEGSRRLLEVSDSIEEVKTTCHFCNRSSCSMANRPSRVPRSTSAPKRNICLHVRAVTIASLLSLRRQRSASWPAPRAFDGRGRSHLALTSALGTLLCADA
jgi:thymidine kinase